MRNSRILFAFTSLLCASSAMGYGLIGWDWGYQSTPIDEPFELNANTFPASAGTNAELHDAYANALARWGTEGGAPTFSYIDGGTTNNTSWSSDGRNIGQYANSTNGSTVALAQSWGWGSEMDDCDIRFYGSNGFGNINWSSDPTGPGNNEMDFELIASHELGHCLGLDHSNAGDAVMYPSSTSGTSVAMRTLAPDDRLGLQAIYGAPADATLEISGVTYSEIGDGDGLVEPGEQVSLNISVDNTSSVAAMNAFATAASTEAAISFVSDAATPVTDPDHAAFSVDDYEGVVFDITSSCTTNDDLLIDLDLFADNFTSLGVVRVGLPVVCAAPDPLTLSLSNTWTPGQPINLHVTGALPGERVYIGRSTSGAAGGPCPAILGGSCLDIESPATLWTTQTADANGEVDWNPTLPGTAPSATTVYVQAAIPRGVNGDQSVISNWQSRVLQ